MQFYMFMMYYVLLYHVMANQGKYSYPFKYFFNIFLVFQRLLNCFYPLLILIHWYTCSYLVVET